MPRRPADAVSLAKTQQNQQAARALVAARKAAGHTQQQFLAAISEVLATRPYAQNALSAWESGDRAIPAAVLIAATQISGRSAATGYATLVDTLPAAPRSVEYFWVTAELVVPRRVSRVQQNAFIESIVAAYNSRFKKRSEVAWRHDERTAVVSMAAGGYSADEVERSVIDMIKRHVAVGAEIAPQHAVNVRVLGTRRL
jgi:transcriptional regulator with XRE-family HTH domain